MRAPSIILFLEVKNRGNAKLNFEGLNDTIGWVLMGSANSPIESEIWMSSNLALHLLSKESGVLY